MKEKLFLFTILVGLITACDMGRIGKIGQMNLGHLSGSTPEVVSVSIVNNQIIVTGSNLQDVTDAKVQGSTNHTFDIESQTSSQLVLNAKAAISFLVGGTFDLLISNANGAATFPISFTLADGQVTAQKLHSMSASAGQVLQFNGTSWAPASISAGQIYSGTYDADNNLPDIAALGGPAGTYYIVTTAGIQNLSGTPINFSVGDWAIFDGSAWSSIPYSGSAVSSFKGRTGSVVPLADDYTWGMLHKTSGKLTGSKISDIADVDVTGIADGFVLKWQTNKWIAAAESVVGSGSITSTEIADGTIGNADISSSAAIAQSKVLNLTTDLAAKEPTITAGIAAQYYRGDKTWQTLNTTAVPEGTNLYFTDIKVRATPLTGYTAGTAIPIDPTDNLMVGLGKLEGQIAALNTSGQWTKASNDIYFNTGDVGVGTTTPARLLHVGGPMRVNPTTLPSPAAVGDIAIDSADGNKLKWHDGSVWQTIGTGSGDLKKDGTVAMSGNFQLGAYVLSNDGSTNGITIDTAGRTSITGGNGTTPQELSVVNTSSANNSKIELNYYHGAMKTAVIEEEQVSAGNNSLAFYTKSSATLAERMRIHTNGSVGIGTASPNSLYSLDVSGRIRSDSPNGSGISTPLTIANSNAGSAAGSGSSISFTGGGTNMGSIESVFELANNTNSYLAFSTERTNTVSEKMRIDSLGNVGIGTTGPQRLLHVAGPIRVAASTVPASPAIGDIYVDSSDANKLKWHNGVGWQTVGTGTGTGDFLKDGTVAMTGPLKITNGATGAPSLAFASEPTTGLYLASAANVALDVAGHPMMYLSNSIIDSAIFDVDILQASGSVQTGNGGAASPTHSFASDTNTGMYLAGTNTLGFSTNGAHRMSIDGTGVGIGTATPNRLLEVAGPIRISASTVPASAATGDIYIDSADTNKLKWYDGSIWQTVATGASSGDFKKDGTVAMTGNIQLPVGAVGTPSINFTGSTTTGIFRPAANVVGFSSNGVNVMNVGGSNGVEVNTILQVYSQISGESSNGTIYTPTSATQITPNAASKSGTIQVYNSSGAGNGKGAYFLARVINSSSLGQNAYFGAVSEAGAANYSPNIVIGHQTGASAYAERMRIDGSGNVGIGTTTTTEKLNVSGNVLATAYLYSSDERLKKNIETIPDALDKMLSLKGVTYNWRKPSSIEDQRRQIGVIAQDVEKVFPEAVQTSSNGIKRVNYPALVAPIIEAIKNLYEEIFGVKNEVVLLKAENEKLREENAAQNKQLDEMKARLEKIENMLSQK